MAFDKRDQLYDNLINSGRVSENEIGSREDFKNAIKDEASSRQFYKNLSGSGLFSEAEIGSEDDFFGSIKDDFKPKGKRLEGERSMLQKVADVFLPKEDIQTTLQRGQRTIEGIQDFDKFTGRMQKRQGLQAPKRVTLGETGNLQEEQHLNPETGKLENSYVTAQGNEYQNKAIAEQEQRKIDERERYNRWRQEHPKEAMLGDLDSQIAKLEDEKNSIQQDNQDYPTTNVNGVMYMNPVNLTKNNQARSDLQYAIDDLKEARTRLKRSQQLHASSDFLGGIGIPFTADWFNNWKNFNVGLWDALNDPSFYSFGTTDLGKAQVYMRMKDKMERGEALTDQETALAMAGMSLAQAQQIAEVPHGYTAGENTMDMAPFMLQMAANPASGVGRAFARQAVRKFGRQGIKAVSARMAARVLGNLGEAAALSNTLQAGSTAANILQRYTGDSFEYDDNGKLMIGHYEDGPDGEPHFVEGGKGALQSAWEGEASSIIENFTELGLGGNLNKFLGKMATSKAGRAVGMGYVSDLVSKIGATPFARNMKKFMERTHWDGMIEEPLEEEYGIILNSLLTGDNKISDLWDSNQQADIFAGTMWFGGMMAAMNTAAYPYYRRKMKQQMQQADMNGQKAFGDEWDVMKAGIEEMDDKQVADYLYSIKDNDAFSNEQKAALVGYTARLKQYQGASVGDMLSRLEGNLSKEEVDIRNAYDEGTELTEPQEMHDAKMNLDVQRGKLEEIASDELLAEFDQDPMGALQGIINNENWEPEEKQVALDYVNARMKYDGMLDSVRDDIDSKIAESDATIDKRTNPADQMVHPAMTNNDRQVYVVGGSVVMNQDGSGVDVEATRQATGGDGMILAIDAETGEVKGYDAEDFKYADQPMDASQMKQENAEVIRQTVSQQAADKIEGKLAFAQGDSYQILDEQGQEHTVQVFEDQGDGTVAVYIDENPQAQVMAKDTVQAMSDAYQATRIEEPATEVTGTGRNDGEGSINTAGGENPTIEEGGESNQQATALSQIPVMQDQRGNPARDKQGNPAYQWHMAPVETTADALMELSGGDQLMARDTATSMIDKARGELEKARKLPVKGDDPITITNSRKSNAKAVADAQAKVKYWQDVNQEMQRRMRETEAANRAAREAAKTEEQRAAEAEAQRQQKEQQDAIVQERRREQIEKDRKERTRPYAALERAKKEVKGDAYAESLLENVEPQTLDEWVSSLLRPHSIMWDDEGTLQGLQSELGLPKNEVGRIGKLLATRAEGGKPFAQVVDEIHEGLPEAMKEQYDDQAVRNTLIKLFGEGNADRMMHLTEEHRIEAAREAVAEQQRRDEEAELQAWAEANHLTPEERDAFEAYLQQPPTEPEQDIINQIIADNEQNRTSRAMDQQPVVGTDAAGAEGSQGQVQQAAEAAGNGVYEETVAQGPEADSSEPATAGNTVVGAAEREALAVLLDQVGADPTLADNMSDYEVEQMTAMVENWEAVNDNYGQVIEQNQDKLKSKDKAVRDAAQKVVDEAQARANEAFEPIHQYIEELQAKYGQYEEEGAIPTPSIDEPRFNAIRQALIDAYKSGDPVAIQQAAQAVQQYVDEGLDSVNDKDQSEYDMLYEYDGNDPEQLAEQYIERTFLDRYLDDDEDQEYIRTGLKPSMRQSEQQPIGKTSSAEEIAAEEAKVDTNPTEGQKEAGNYQKGHINVDGYDITIENPKGSIRRGTDASGKQWEQEMHNTYGYIKGTEGVDGDHIDVFLSDNPTGGNVFVVDQVNKDGSFDEHKVMYGFNSEEEARQAYLSNYEEGWQGLGAITEVSREEFKKWVESSHRKTKPFTEYKSVKAAGEPAGTEVKSEKPAKKAEKPKREHKRIVSDDQMAELRKKLLAKMNQANSGLDIERMLIGAAYAVGKIERGVTKFADFCADMVADLGDAIRPYLKLFYNGARDLPEAAELRPLMDDREYVENFDVDNFDKEKEPNVLEKAEQVHKQNVVKQQAKKIEKEAKKKLEQGVTQLDLFAEETATEVAGTERSTERSTEQTDANATGTTAKSEEAETNKPKFKDGTVLLRNNTYNKIVGSSIENGERIYELALYNDAQSLADDKPATTFTVSESGLETEIATGAYKPNLDKSDYRTYITPEAKIYFRYHDPRFVNNKRSDMNYITAAVWDGVVIPEEELVKLPEIVENEKKVKEIESQEPFTLTNEQIEEHANHLLDAEHGSAVYNGKEINKVNGHEDFSGPVKQERKAFIIIGRPAGGKSSVFANPLSNKHGARIIDSDVVKEWFDEFENGYGAGYVQDMSSAVAERALDIAVQNGDNIVLPRIGGDSVARLSAALRMMGYDVQLYYNDVVPETSYMRSNSRCAMTGRYLSLDYLTSIKDKPSKFFSKFAGKNLGDYLNECTQEEVQKLRRRLESMAGSQRSDLLRAFDGWMERRGRKADDQRVSGNVERPESGVVATSIDGETPIFSYSEWKSNDVAFGEKPKEIWNSKSGTPLSEVLNEKGYGRKREGTPEADRMQRQGDSTQGTGRENRPGSVGVSSGEPEGSRTTDQGGVDSGLQESRNDRQGDSSVQEGERANSQGVERSERPSGAVQQLETPKHPKNLRNNHAERGKDYAPKGVDARIEANIKAIETMQQLIESGEQATDKQKAVLRQYSGWGGLGKAFDDAGYSQRLRELLGEEAYQQAVMSRNSAYYTPAMVIDTMWDIAKAMGFKGGNVLEGSAGIGNIIGQMPTDMSERSNIQAVEIDSTTGNILKLLYPDAQVDIQGFEQTRVPNGSVDLAITNVPFVTGLRVMDTTGDKDLSKKFHDIHDFCIAKNIRKLKDGGIGIFITSSGTLDNSKKLRDWITSEGNADVVGAFRLNNETFGGTGATSDIIVVRKRVAGKTSPNKIDVSLTSGERTAEYDTGELKRVKGEYVPVTKQVAMDYNQYFVEHPEQMAGEMLFGFEKGDTFRPMSKALYPVKGKDQAKMLAEWVKSFEGKDWESNPATELQGTVQPEAYEKLGPDVKEGSMVLSNGKLCVAQFGKAVPLDLNANKVKGHTKQECFKSYQGIKQALTDVLEYQMEHEDNDGLKPLQDKLNKAYDSFVRTYGHFHKNNQLAFLKNDVDYPNVFALETYKETGDPKTGKRIQTFGKTDIFSKRVVEKEKEPKPKSINDAIIAGMYVNGRIDTAWIADKLNESGVQPPHGDSWTQDDVRKGILASGLGFEDPSSNEITVAYEYLSGNVREKLQQALDNNQEGRYNANIKALEKIMPLNIPAHLIDFSIGSSWIDPKLYEEYVKEKTDIDVKFTPVGGTWHMQTPSWILEEKNKTAGVYSEILRRTFYGTQLIEAAMTNKTIEAKETKKKWNGETETIVDKEATQAISNKIDEIRQDFKEWAKAKMQSNPELAQEVEKKYNDTFNNYVPKTIPDEFIPEHFTGASTRFKLKPHQAQGAIRGTTQPLLLAHEVGSGKTFTLITTAMEMRRLGTARKPMIVVQNATLAQFVSDAKALYPNAKVLTIEDKDHTAEGRKNFYAKIKYNDWDMIVVPQSVFERIPDSEERQMAYVHEKIEEKLLVLEQMKNADKTGNSMIVRQAEKEIEKLENELADLSGTLADKRKKKDEKKAAVTRQNAEVKALEMLDREVDDVENFDDMGIDALLVDEAHEYKHLGFSTAMQRGVKGVDPSYSKKAQGVFLKTQAILENNNGRNVVFATGTPISNTAAEIWTFMRYLMPADVMKDYGIYYFDDFVRNFGNLTQMLEFTTSGKFKENNRFAGYINLPELARIWSSVADIKLNKEIEDERKARGEETAIPEEEGGKDQDIYLPQTKALRSVMKYVKSELERYENMSGKEKKENSHIPLTMYGIAKAAAVDARLVVDDATDEPQSKTNEAVRQTLRSLEETKSYKGTIALFADNYQNKRSGFNLYEDIKKKLIEAGVPADQIAIIKSGMTIKKKQEIFDKVNSGEIRVIMGSTFTLGTGVNIQERLHTLIHLDAPNRPMDYTQRNGRILRQGNLHKQMGKPVRVLRFGVEDSLDVTAYQRLKTKGAIADSIMHSKDMMANSMENRALEEEEDVFGDTVAQLSGSEYAMLKNQAEKDVRKYEAKKKQWEADQAYVHTEIPRVESYIRGHNNRIKELEGYLKIIDDAYKTAGKAAGTTLPITVGKQTYADVEAMGDFIKDYNKKLKETENELRDNPSTQSSTRQLTVNIGGVDFIINTEQSVEVMEGQGTLFTAVRRRMTYDCPEFGIKDEPVHQSLLRNALDDISQDIMTGKDFRERLQKNKDSVEQYEKQLAQMKERDGKPFQYTEQLEKAHEHYDEYSELMKKELEEKEKKYAEMDKTVEAASDVEASEEAQEEEETNENVNFRDDEEDEESEIEAIIREAKANGTFMLAPNGNPSNLNPHQWAQVRTAAFKKWFGDWENDPEHASKVVDENGEPKVMYHKTDLNQVNQGEPFWTFYEDSHFGTPGQANDRVRYDEGTKTYEVFLNIRNPQRRNDADQDYLEEKDMSMREYWDLMSDRSKSQGHDGIVYLNEYEDPEHPADSWIAFRPQQIKSATENVGTFSEETGDIRFRIRESEPPKKTGIGYKVFVVKDGKLYPPMVANPNGEDTPVGEWLDADAAPIAGQSKTGRPQVKAGGKGTQGGSGQLAYRPGWHLGTIPYASQFNRKDAAGERTLFPKNFVWAEVEYADDVDYQQEAHDAGVNENGKYQHSLAGLKHVPYDGSYRYRTNPDPKTDEWIITGAMKVNRILKPSEVDEMVKAAGREPQPRQDGAITDADVEKLNKQLYAERLEREGEEPAGTERSTGRKRTKAEQRRAEAYAQRQFRRAKELARDTIAKLGMTDKVTVLDNAEGLSGRKAKAKGWYDKDTGKVVIVLNNHRSPSDVMMTILHECVAHYGLRQLFGKNFDQFLKNVYDNASFDIKMQIADLAAKQRAKDKKYGRKELTNDEYMMLATEEYLASLAETTDFEDAETQPWLRHWFNQIKQWFLDMLDKVGLSGFEGELTDNELRYILCRSYKNLTEPGRYRNVFQQAEDIAMQVKLNVGDYKRRPVEDTIVKNVNNRNDEIQIEKKVAEMSMDEVEEAYKRIDDMMRDENGLDLDEQFDAHKQEYINKNGLSGIGPFMANDLQQAMDKYGSGMIELRWELQDRLFGAGRYAGEDNTLMRDDEEDEEDDGNIEHIDTGRPSLEDAIIDGLVKLAKQNADNIQLRIDAMKAIGGNLSKLRQAMAKQRAYDKETVYQIVRLAKSVMDIGGVDSLTRGEVKKLVGLIAGAAGKEDITTAAKKVVDMLINNQLRQLKNLLGKQLSIRGTKISNKGVEMQGQLDVEGARMVNAMKDGMHLTMQSLQERISDCMDRMGSDDETISKQAAVEYQGYMLAQQYVQDIKQSEEDERNLKYELVRAKEDWQAGMMTREQYEELRDSIEDTIMDVQIERIGKYHDFMKNVGSGMRDSVQRAREWRDQEIKRANEIRHNANSDMEGRPYDEHHKPTVLERAANWSWVRFFMKPLATFDQMLRLFGAKNVNGEGYLWNRFMTGYTEASDKEWRNLWQDYKDLDAKVSEVFGKKMKWSDLFSMERKMEGAKVKFWDGGEMKEHTLTPGNLLYIYMADKMSDGRMKLRRMGITEDDVLAIKNHLDPRFIELADWLQNEYLPMKRKYFNAVHEKMFGASMAAISDYFPLVINKRDLVKEEEVGSEDYLGDDQIGATITGNIIKRTKNAKALDITNADAFDVILGHLQQMEHWAAYAEMNKDLGTLLSYKHFRNQVLNMRTLQYGSGQNLWVNFKRAAAVVSGAYRPKIDKDSVDTSLVNLAKGVTAAKISMRLYTALKQMLSYPAYLSEASIWELVKSTNPYGAVNAFNWAIDNLPGFSKRWQSRISGDTRLQPTDIDWGFWKNNIVKAASRIGLTPNAFIDALTVAMGAKAIYETKKKQYLNDGYSEEQADEKAKNAAAISFNETQQSSENAYVSAMQLDRTVASVALTVFRNASMGYMRRLTNAYRNFGHMVTPGYKQQSIAFMQKQMMRDGLTEQQAERAAKRAYNRSWYKNIADMVIFGFVMQVAWNLGPYLPYLLAGDDDDEKDKMLTDAFAHALAGHVEGLTGGAQLSELYNLARSGGDISSYQFNLLPLMSDIQTMLRHFKSDSVAGWNDVINILVQSGIGVNPQTLTDVFVAIMDASNGDLNTAKETAILIMRILQAPQSAIDKLYIDELGMSGEEARKLSAEELAKRYARYKRQKNAPLTGWAYRDEEEAAVEEKYVKKFTNKIKERLSVKDEQLESDLQNETDEFMKQLIEKEVVKRAEDALDEMNDAEIAVAFDRTDDPRKRKLMAKRIAKQAGASKDTYGAKSSNEYAIRYQELRTSDDVYEDSELLAMQEAARDAGDDELAAEISKARAKVHKMISGITFSSKADYIEEVMRDMRSERRKLLQKLKK